MRGNERAHLGATAIAARKRIPHYALRQTTALKVVTKIWLAAPYTKPCAYRPWHVGLWWGCGPYQMAFWPAGHDANHPVERAAQKMRMGMVWWQAPGAPTRLNTLQRWGKGVRGHMKCGKARERPGGGGQGARGRRPRAAPHAGARSGAALRDPKSPTRLNRS